MELRPYQIESIKAVKREWANGHKKTLLVLPTGCGKTIVFSHIARDCVWENNNRVLILAHRGELLEQAADKLKKATGLTAVLEKAEETSVGKWAKVVVGSVQTMMREKRLKNFTKDYFGTIIIDEAHHALANSYKNILEYFKNANVLGVTATPDRGDKKNLGEIFESLAYEYSLSKAIKEGFLCPIKAQTIPLELDIKSVKIEAGDYKAADLGNSLEPYLDAIAKEIKAYVTNGERKKTLVFLPLVHTSKKLCDILNALNIRAAEVNGNSPDRAEILQDFHNGKYDILCNSMLLTEGFDEPEIDCVIVLRPTKSRNLYCQMVGRGTRLAEGKKDLLLLDFLWMTERHELCHPASLIAPNKEIADAMTEKIKESGAPEDLEEMEKEASQDAVEQREKALARELKEMKTRKRKLVDPLQFEFSIQAEDLINYVPSFGSEMLPPSDKQKEFLEKRGIFTDEIDCAGKASLIINKLIKRQNEGLTTPKQIRFLENKGFKHVGTWQFEEARKLIDRIAANGWKVPKAIDPETFKPEISVSVEVQNNEGAWEQIA